MGSTDQQDWMENSTRVHRKFNQNLKKANHNDREIDLWYNPLQDKIPMDIDKYATKN